MKNKHPKPNSMLRQTLKAYQQERDTLKTERDRLRSLVKDLVGGLEMVKHSIANAWEWQVSEPEDSELDRDQQIGSWCEKACDQIDAALTKAKAEGY